MKKESKMLNVVSVAVVIVIIILVASLIAHAVKGTKTSTNQSTQTTESVAGDSQSNAMVLSDADLKLTGPEFAQKYSDKYVSFDGLLQGTATIKGAPAAHTELVMGDDINSGTLADASPFWITAGTGTFSDSLSMYATNNSTPYESKNYPKVHVVAKVKDYSDTYTVVQLDPISNIDGKTPSVTTR